MEVIPVFTYATTCICIQDQTQVGEARRAVGDMARTLQMSQEIAGKASIIATELATNLVNHGGGGTLLLNPVWQDNGSWIDILALDKGPGMANVSRCMEDGYSTMGTAGNGLGAVQRMASIFEIVSLPGEGTAVLARVLQGESLPPAKAMDVAAVNVPKPRETVSGDAWAVRFMQDETLIMVADGLGHGFSAADASGKALHSFASQPVPEVYSLMENIHGALRTTRGAAISIASIHHKTQNVSYCGIGNVSGSLISDEHRSKSMISQNGIVGHDSKRIRVFDYNSTDSSLLIMHSDGLQSHWSLAKYPGIFRRQASLIAGILYRDFCRGSDDVSVVVAKK